jgi:hypothetical protein
LKVRSDSRGYQDYYRNTKEIKSGKGILQI